jgi:hypothetical protein
MQDLGQGAKKHRIPDTDPIRNTGSHRLAIVTGRPNSEVIAVCFALQGHVNLVRSNS